MIHRGMPNLVLIFFMSVAAASEMTVIGIIGQPVLLPCYLNAFKNTDPARLRFYWQDKDLNVLYSFNKGEEEKNRTKGFTAEMSSGNLSIEISIITHRDNFNTYHAVAMLLDDKNEILKENTKACLITLEVAARFLAPIVTKDDTQMTATCSTWGGFPEPEVTWIIHNQAQQQTRTLNTWEVQTKMTRDPESGLYTVWSQVNFTKEHPYNMTCSIFNPVLRETASKTIEISVTPESNQATLIDIVLLVLPVVVGVVLLGVVVSRVRELVRRCCCF